MIKWLVAKYISGNKKNIRSKQIRNNVSSLKLLFFRDTKSLYEYLCSSISMQKIKRNQVMEKTNHNDITALCTQVTSQSQTKTCFTISCTY